MRGDTRGDVEAGWPPGPRRSCGLRSSLRGSLPASPCWVRGSPPPPLGRGPKVQRVRRPFKDWNKGPNGETCGTTGSRQVARSAGAGKTNNGAHLVGLEEEGGAVEDFFGQLWFIPSDPPSPGGHVRV